MEARGFSLRRWLKRKEEVIVAKEADKNALQFQAYTETIKALVSGLNYESYERGGRVPAVERKKSAKPSA